MTDEEFEAERARIEAIANEDFLNRQIELIQGRLMDSAVHPALRGEARD
jgi:hypothetical protein